MDYASYIPGASGIAGGLFGLFGGGSKDPSKAASPYFQQIPNAISPYYSPFINAGIGIQPHLQDQYADLLNQYGGQLSSNYSTLVNNPSDVYNKIAGQYQQSPGYKFQYDQAMNAANNAAASGGMAGSPQHQQQAATLAQNLASQDFNNYLSKALGLYGTGLEGEHQLFGTGLQGYQNIYNQGIGAANSMAEQIAQALAAQGSLAYAGQANKNQAQGSALGTLLGGIGSLFGIK